MNPDDSLANRTRAAGPVQTAPHNIVGCTTLLEREQSLAELADWWLQACRGHGCVALIAGEAGIGKTALVREFERRVSGRKLLGLCEPSSMPRPLGPLIDMAPRLGGAVAQHLAAGERVDVVSAALVADLNAETRPTLIMVDDAQWADASSLDLLRFLGRRIGRLRSMLVVTLRDDEIGPTHPLQIVLGDLASCESVRRIRLEPLSVAAVRKLATGRASDAGYLHHRTGGNPFFVTEMLADSSASVPATVRNALLARVARLASAERCALEATAVLGVRARGEWVDAMIGCTDALASSLARGLVQTNGELVTFRHQLVREVLLSTIPGEQRRVWHARALAVISADPGRRSEKIADLANHADGAADPLAAREYCVAGARAAARVHAHRQAAEHYERAQGYFSNKESREYAEILESHAHERNLIDEVARAIDLRSLADGLWQRLGDPMRSGDNLRWLSNLAWFAGRAQSARDYAHRAIETLEPQGKGRELAAAYSNQSQLHMYANEVEPAIRWGRKAIALARQLGDIEIEGHARNNVGAARTMAGDPRGIRELERSLALAREAHIEEPIARALTNKSMALIATRDLRRAHVALAEGLEYTEAHKLDTWHCYMRGYLAIALLHGGRLAEAVEVAFQLLGTPGCSMISRIQPLTVLGRARARRGDPEIWPVLDEALALAEQTGEMQRIGPVRIARGEAAWLAGDVKRARQEVTAALPLAQRLCVPWLAGEFMFVLALSGEPRKPPPWLASPFSLYLRRQFAASAKAWSALGCPYEQAWSLAGDESESGLRTAFETLESLGMVAAAARARERLRALGVRKIPRGRRATTVANAAGLTTREVEVLALLADGLRNAEIGRRLFISLKTVEHHVSSILGKVDVDDRIAAAGWYRQHMEHVPK